MILNAFAPKFTGTWRAEVMRVDLFERLAARVEAGRFLPMTAASRNCYSIVARHATGLQLRADSLLTAIGVGLNEVVLERSADGGAVNYQVSYQRWSQYAYALCLVIVAPLVLGLQFPAVREQMGASVPLREVILAAGFFWGVVWPAVLTRMHRRPAARLLERILDEVNAEDDDA